jgi:5-methylcytosine-specific restriction endonuclease McrA
MDIKFELEDYHRNITDDDLLEDLNRISKMINKDSVTIDEYNEAGNYNASTLIRRFGSWFKTLEKAGLKRTRTLGVSDEEYFMNLEEVWIKLGRQPRYEDMQKPLSKYCAGAYEYRFGSWRKSLKKFIDFINNEKLHETGIQEEIGDDKSKRHRTKKSISWRLRFLIMRRDNFRCKICGESPAKTPGVILQVDHIVPWSKGGETLPENLQTLCIKCNIGKSDIDSDSFGTQKTV